MMLEYKLGARQYRRFILLPLLKLSIIIVIATAIGGVWLDIQRGQLLMVIGLTWAWIFLIHLLPLLIMGIRHNHLSKGVYFIVDTVNNTYQYNSKEVSFLFQLAEIDKVVKVVSPPKYDGRADILGFGHFFYWKIILIDGRTLSLSCMLLDLEDFPGRKANHEKRLFPVP